MLYVGASPARFELVDLFCGRYEIDVYEAFLPNVRGLIKINEELKIFRAVMHGDITILDPEIVRDLYDIVLWHHGPEHIRRKKLRSALETLEAIAKHLVILGCPFGRAPQGPVKGNKYERHLSTLYPEDFEKLGYKTATIRKAGARGAHILAWKKLK